MFLTWWGNIVCMVHNTNLIGQVLSNLPMVAKLEDLCWSLYFYFSSSLKQHLELNKFIEIVKTVRLKILKNVKIWRMSMLEPLKQVMAKFKTLVVKMSQQNPSIVQVSSNFDILFYIHTYWPCLVYCHCWR